MGRKCTAALVAAVVLAGALLTSVPQASGQDRPVPVRFEHRIVRAAVIFGDAASEQKFAKILDQLSAEGWVYEYALNSGERVKLPIEGNPDMYPGVLTYLVFKRPKK